jgi:hypothetical protein
LLKYILIYVSRVCNCKWLRGDEQKLRVCLTRTEKLVVGDYIDCCDGNAKVIANSSVFVKELIGT